MTEIKNWKLKEVSDYVEIITTGTVDFIEKKLKDLKVPEKSNFSINRDETFIDWKKVVPKYNFFFDYEGQEKRIEDFFKQSKISSYNKIVITYLQNDIVVKIPFSVFIQDWEGFIRSTQYNGLIFSEDYKLIIEVTRSYYMYSNFEISPVQ